MAVSNNRGDLKSQQIFDRTACNFILKWLTTMDKQEYIYIYMDRNQESLCCLILELT